MTAWIFALAAVGFVVVLGILTYHLVLTLRQTRRTARALEQFLVVTRPRVEDSVLQVNQILLHTNRIVEQAERSDSGRVASGFVRQIGHLAAYARAAMQAVHVVKGLKSDVQQAWNETRSAGRGPQGTRVRYSIGGE